MPHQVVIEAKFLGKNYDDIVAVDGIHFQVKAGECFGLLGPNGAGKSTTLRMMYGSTQPSQGDLFVLGMDIRKNTKEVKRRIGVIPQDDGLDPDFSVLDNLKVFASYYGMTQDKAEEKAAELLQWVKLDEYSHRGIATLSGGMRRRLAIARGLINSPEILFLDEPTTGLDPQARLWIWDFLRSLKKQGSSLVLTTHYMEEAEVLCDRLAVIDQGQILAFGTPKELIKEHIGVEVLEVECADDELVYYKKKAENLGLEAQIYRDRIAVFLAESKDAYFVMGFAQGKSFALRKAGLNDVFLKLAGHELRDE